MRSEPFSYDAAPVELKELGDASIAVRRYGDGPDLLFVHGFPLHGYTWRYLLPELAARFRCWVVDLPGFGDSRWSPDTNLGFTAQAGRLNRLLRELGVTRSGVIAHDTGATIARLLALDAPDLVHKLAIINTEMPGHRPPWIPLYIALSRLPGTAFSFRALMSLRSYRRSAMGFGGLFVDKSRLDGDFEERFIEPLLSDRKRLLGTLKFLQDVDWAPMDALAQRHREIKAGVLLLWGELDPTFPVEIAEAMCPQFARLAGFHRIRDAKLMPHEEQPAQVLEHLLPFLA